MATNGTTVPPTRRGKKLSLQEARDLDVSDPLRHFRNEFIIPSQADLKRTSLYTLPQNETFQSERCIYLCGNSLGVQPRRVTNYVSAQLRYWATKGVYGHFKPLSDSPIPAWTRTDKSASEAMSKIVGASPSEVAVMQTLTMNLHILMTNFYRPTPSRHKIIIEAKAFPSDHYAVESQIRSRGLSVGQSMVLIEPPSEDSPILPTEHILGVIDQHAQSAALLLLPGIQYYSGQLLDMPAITKHAQERGIVVGWDLAHAVGNVPLELHDWNVDFAAWCTYKYLNCGPGAMGGLFVHSRHHEESSSSLSPRQTEAATTSNGTTTTTTTTTTAAAGANHYDENDDSNPSKHEHEHEHKRRRLTGWWGHDLSSRFQMDNKYEAAAGALGFQLSNPSVLEHAVILASLSVFNETSMAQLRAKSVKLTAFLETALLEASSLPNNRDLDNDIIAADVDVDVDVEEQGKEKAKPTWTIITPHDPTQRGAQLSICLEEGLLDTVMHGLEDAGVVVDERHPDVVRVAPTPLYNTFEDVWTFVQIFKRAVLAAKAHKQNQTQT